MCTVLAFDIYPPNFVDLMCYAREDTMLCRIALAAFLAFLAAVALLPDTQTHFGFDINPLNEGYTSLNQLRNTFMGFPLSLPLSPQCVAIA